MDRADGKLSEPETLEVSAPAILASWLLYFMCPDLFMLSSLFICFWFTVIFLLAVVVAPFISNPRSGTLALNFNYYSRSMFVSTRSQQVMQGMGLISSLLTHRTT